MVSIPSGGGGGGGIAILLVALCYVNRVKVRPSGLPVARVRLNYLYHSKR